MKYQCNLHLDHTTTKQTRNYTMIHSPGTVRYGTSFFDDAVFLPAILLLFFFFSKAIITIITVLVICILPSKHHDAHLMHKLVDVFAVVKTVVAILFFSGSSTLMHHVCETFYERDAAF